MESKSISQQSLILVPLLVLEVHRGEGVDDKGWLRCSGSMPGLAAYDFGIIKSC